MRKFLTLTGILTLLLVASPVAAHQTWDLTDTYDIVFTCTSGCSGDYPHTMEIDTVDLVNETFSGTGTNGSITWTIQDGEVSGSILSMTIDYDSSAYYVDMVGDIAPDGTLYGTAENATQAFTWKSTGGSASHINHGEITEPEVGEIVFNETDLVAQYHDESPDMDDDIVQWAVRKGTCAAGAGTVFGNVDGHNDSYNWNGSDFSSTMDTSGMDAGSYCFIFNPKDDSGQNNVRETREFYIAESYINGGGHILEKEGKRKNWMDVSFGGWIANVGELIGEWQVNFHNTGDSEISKGKFHTTEITDINLYNGNGNTCVEAMNFTALGTFNGEDGYKIIFRAGDSGLPASESADTTRVTLIKIGEGVIYDTYPTDFTPESSCIGTARTGLDTGNISIVDNS